MKIAELEREVAKLPFRSIHILRPSLLIGKRQEFRLGERIATAIAPLLDLFTLGSLRHYHSIRADVVGRAMVAAARSSQPGIHVYEYDEIVTMGRA